MTYPKRLIEVDLPIRRISDHARREKSIRHGHISTLHIWWARRPLASCRAVICAALWPDPADELCPEAFRQVARVWMGKWSKEYLAKVSPESYTRFISIQKTPAKLDDNLELRVALLDFIADFANWDNSTVKAYLDTSLALTLAAHEALGGAPGTRPLVVDPFAGGGSIPLEALRVGADAFASDLNPIPVLLNKVVLEYIPKYGQRLADEVRKWGAWIKQEAEKELAEFYPKDPDGATPIAYLWARTIQCEGPGCGAEVPLIRSLWLAKKPNRSVALQLVVNQSSFRQGCRNPASKDGNLPVGNPPESNTVETGKLPSMALDSAIPVRNDGNLNSAGLIYNDECRSVETIKRVDFKIIVKLHDGWVNQDDPQEKIANPKFDGTVKRGSATCPCCGYTTPVARVRVQLKARRGGANDARLMCVVSTRTNETGRFYRQPIEDDLKPIHKSENALRQKCKTHISPISFLPDEKLDIRGIRHTWGMIYGQETWTDHFSHRQLLSLTTITRLVQEVAKRENGDANLHAAVTTCLALNVGKLADLANSLCPWEPVAECPRHLFSRQAIPFTWDFGEGVAIGDSSGSWQIMIDRFATILAGIGSDWCQSSPYLASATDHPLPDDSANAIVTDPPYYDAVPYAYLFASKTTASWEAILKAVIDAGWIITGSWPIDTEMETRVSAQGQARLASSSNSHFGDYPLK